MGSVLGLCSVASWVRRSPGSPLPSPRRASPRRAPPGLRYRVGGVQPPPPNVPTGRTGCRRGSARCRARGCCCLAALSGQLRPLWQLCLAGVFLTLGPVWITHSHAGGESPDIWDKNVSGTVEICISMPKIPHSSCLDKMKLYLFKQVLI